MSKIEKLAFMMLVFFLATNVAVIMTVNEESKVIQNKITNSKNKEVVKETNINKSIEVLVRNQDVNYLYGEATAYCPSEGGINSDSNSEVTSIGKPAKNGVIAVNPKVIPYGSEIMIIHDKTVIRGTAADTGGAMRQNPHQVDILMKDIDKAKKWGRKKVHIIWW